MSVAWSRPWSGTRMALLGCVVLLVMAGCAQTAREDRAEQQDRVLVRETVEVRQDVHDGQVIELRTKTRVVEQEQTDREARRDERIEVEAPKVIDAIKPLASAAATAVIGPASGAAVDWLWQAIAGVGAAGTLSGAGMVMHERIRRRQLIRAQDAYVRDIEQAETDDDIAEIKRKHAERQKALGIHEQLTRERHGG